MEKPTGLHPETKYSDTALTWGFAQLKIRNDELEIRAKYILYFHQSLALS